MKKWTLLVAVVLTGMLIGTAAAKKGELEMKDGRRFYGEVTEKPDAYELNQPGVGSVTLAKSDVKAVEYFETPQDGYKQKRARIANNDAKALYELGQWAQRYGLNEEMAEAAKSVLAVSPQHIGAKLLLAAYEDSKRTGPPVNPPNVKDPIKPPDDTTKPPVPPVAATGPADRISDKDMNQLRLLEMSADGEKLAMVFKVGALDKFWKSVEGKDDDTTGDARHKAFLRMQPYQQLEFMKRKVGVDNFYQLAEDVTIRQDPAAMIVWKRDVHSWVIRTCGSAQCHGGNAAAPFRLVTNSPMNDNAFYTNFLIISEFVGKDGRVLDRDQADRSLLLQYALPVDSAETQFRHPKINGSPIQSGLRSRSDENYRVVIRWLSRGERGSLRVGLDKLPYRINFPIGQSRNVQPPPVENPDGVPPGGGPLPPPNRPIRPEDMPPPVRP